MSKDFKTPNPYYRNPAYEPGPGPEMENPRYATTYAAKTGASSNYEEENKTVTWMKYGLFAYNLVIFLFGAVILGVGIWMAIDRNFMTEIIGTDLYVVSLYMILIFGGIIFFISFLGCCGAITENKVLLWAFLIVLAFIAVGLFIGSILAIVFHEELGDSVRDTMEDTLVNYYGIDFHRYKNRAVTWGWDKTQEKLYCCGVRTKDWQVYRKSEWFKMFGSTEDDLGIRKGHEDQKPYVPQSCCVRDRFWRYVNLDVCQKWRLGPPGSPVDGAVNRAIYYEGCYDAGVLYLEENSAVLIGLGITIFLLLILGIVLSLFLIRKL